MADVHDIAPLDAAPAVEPAPAIEVGIELDVDLDRIVAALEDPELLSAWLGEWHEGATTTVRTDDGRRRVVSDRHWRHDLGGDELHWTWRTDGGGPGADSAGSHVCIRLEPVEGGATRLVVRETLASAHRSDVQHSAAASPLLESATWLAGLLALGAVLAASTLARV
jgi:uncharacterized protein YndB with AHSA1/START domain